MARDVVRAADAIRTSMAYLTAAPLKSEMTQEQFVGGGSGPNPLEPGEWNARLSKNVDLCYESGGGFRDDSRRSCAGGRL